MDAAALKAMQAPLKEAYRSDAASALITLRARGAINGEDIACRGGDRPRDRAGRAASGHRRQRPGAVFGRHAAGSAGRLRGRDAEGGGDGAGFQARQCNRRSRGRPRFSRHARRREGRAGRFRAIRLGFRLDTDEPTERIEALTKLTERYCVAFQTLSQRPQLTVAASAQ